MDNLNPELIEAAEEVVKLFLFCSLMLLSAILQSYVRKLAKKYEKEELLDFIEIQVKAAEQIFLSKPKSGKQKKKIVSAAVENYCEIKKINAEESLFTDELIENAVYQMNKEKK